MTEIKPCPFCGSDDVQPGSGVYIECNVCTAFGPTGESKEHAVELWNAAQRVAKSEPSLNRSQAEELEIAKAHKMLNEKLLRMGYDPWKALGDRSDDED